MFFLCFQGIEKGCIGSKWVKTFRYTKNNSVKGVSTKIVKENVNVFATLLVEDIYKFIKKGEIFDKLKASDITPAVKKGDKRDKSNHRPVSILRILSKVYKKYLYKQIENNMENVSERILMRNCAL